MQKAADDADQPTHDAQVVQHRDEAAEKHDHWQHPHGEDETAATEHFEHVRRAEPAEQEVDALVGVNLQG
jgi:hypothetical protein